MRTLSAAILIALGLFLLYAYNTGRLLNIYHVLLNPSATVQSPQKIVSSQDNSGNDIAQNCTNLLDVNCILSVFDTVSGNLPA